MILFIEVRKQFSRRQSLSFKSFKGYFRRNASWTCLSIKLCTIQDSAILVFNNVETGVGGAVFLDI